jgi:hypothetical protein
LDQDKEELTEEMLNQLADEDLLAANFGQLSLNALSTVAAPNAIQLRTLVNNKVMLILLDSGSSHSFISSQFVDLVKLPTVPIEPKKIKLANGQWLSTSTMVKNLQWFIQGETLSSDMIVLDMVPYDAILGYDWLESNSPMNIDW